MRITVFGATGRVGRLLVVQAVAAGHDVTSVVRNPGKLPDRLDSVTADLVNADPVTADLVTADLRHADPAVLASAVRGSDAVLSCIGPRSAAEAGIAETATTAITAAMAAVGALRLVVISAGPVSTLPSPGRPSPPRHDPGDGFVIRNLAAPLVKLIFRRQYADLARMEDVIRSSELDWTIVRPPRLTDGPATDRYRTAVGRNVRGGRSVSRADVAQLMLRVLAEPETIRRAVGIAG